MHRPSLFIGKKHFNCEEALRYNVQREPGGTGIKYGIKANTVEDYYKKYSNTGCTRVYTHTGTVAGLLTFIFYVLLFYLFQSY